MTRRIIHAAAALALAATPTIGFAQEGAQDRGHHIIRNNTQATLSCGLRRARGSAADRFVLAPGKDWQSPEAGDRPRVLMCDAGGDIVPQFRLRPGVIYAVVDAPRGSIAVRIVGP